MRPQGVGDHLPSAGPSIVPEMCSGTMDTPQERVFRWHGEPQGKEREGPKARIAQSAASHHLRFQVQNLSEVGLVVPP